MSEEKKTPETTEEPKAPTKIKNDQIRVVLQEDDVLWQARKRVTIFALPISFTKYTLTKSKLTVRTGFFTQKEEEVRLYRVKDISYTQTLIERMAKVGTLTLVSADTALPELKLEHVKNSEKLKDILSQLIEEARRAAGVRVSELVGAGGMHDHDDCAGESSIHADLNADGVPDCQQ